MRWKKRGLFWARYSFYIFVIVFLLDYIFYLSYKRKIMPSEMFNAKLSELDLRVGWWGFPHDKISSFVNFEENKEKGVIRIGCFGDSCTYGDEVNDVSDYPHLLQRIFDSRGYRGVEVINFGRPWGGFHQAFMLWENVGKKYDLDIIFLGPLCFQNDRDSTFNHSFENSYWRGSIDYFHSRYILKDDDVELLDVIGRTPSQVVSNYWKFIPRMRYLRFDREAPVFLKAPVAFLFPERKIKINPFYYRKDIEGEMKNVYKILLSKMAESGSDIVLGNYVKRTVDLAKELNRPNLHAIELYRRVNFPYQTFGYHDSPMGNQLVAQQMFDYLTNRSKSNLVILETEDVNRGHVKKGQVKKLRLSEYREIAIEIDNFKIGHFYDCVNPIRIETNSELFMNPFRRASSLLAIKYGDNSILDAVFLKIDFEIENNMPLAIEIQTQIGVRRYVLGNIEILNPGLNIGMINLGETKFDRLRNRITITIHHDSFPKIVPFLSRENNATILLNGNPILFGVLKNHKYVLKFDAINKDSRFVVISSDGDSFVDIERLPLTGDIYLSLDSDNEMPIRIPFARWSKTNKKIVW